MGRFSCLSCKCISASDVTGRPLHLPEQNGENARSVQVNGDEGPPTELVRLARKLSTSSLYYFDALDEEQDIFFDAIGMVDENESIKAVVSFDEDRPNATATQSILSSDETLLAPVYRAASQHRKKMKPNRSDEDWGFPGALDMDQLAKYRELRSQLQRRGGVYLEMAYAYEEFEGHEDALCRYLRYCNFNVPNVFKFMDTRMEIWEIAKKNDFYPDAGFRAPLSVFLSQFPSVYKGFAKDGYPVCYLENGKISVEGVSCITDLDKVPNFIWYTLMHECPTIYRKAITESGFKKLSQITVVNLEGLSPSFFTPRTYSVIKHIDFVAATFPEFLHKLLIINAPAFVPFVWLTIRKFIDPNTAKRIEIYSSPEKGKARMLELIDEKEIPCNYGGLGTSTQEAILKVGREGPTPRRQIVNLLAIKKRRATTFDFQLENDEQVSISIYTRSTTRVEFSLLNEKESTINKMDVVSNNDEMSSCIKFAHAKGPGKFTMTGQSDESSAERFLVIGEVYQID